MRADGGEQADSSAEPLIDVTRAASTVGFKLPVTMTRTVFLTCVAQGSDGQDADEHIQSLRLWDVLYTAWRAVEYSTGGASRTFELRQPARHGVPPSLLRLRFTIAEPQPGGECIGVIDFS